MAKVITKNKYAKFNFELLKFFEGGLVLSGPEVKSIRQGNVHIKNSYLTIKDNEIWVINMFIGNYMNIQADEQRTKKILLHKKEINKLKTILETKRLSLVATTLLLNKKGKIKLEFAIGRGKTLRDKREIIKKKDIDKKIQKQLKQKMLNS